MGRDTGGASRDGPGDAALTVIGQAFVEVLPESEGFLASAQQKIEGLLGKLGGPVAAVGGTVLAVGAGLAALGEKYESAFHNIERTTGATGAALAGLEGTFKSVYSSTTGSADEVTAAIDGIYQKTGLAGSALESFSKKEVDLGKITKTDVAQNVAETTTLFNKFGVAAGDQSGELDVLFRASQASGASIGELAQQLQAGATPLKLFGFSLNESTALFASFDRAGVSTERSTVALNKAFVTLTKEGLDPAQAKKRLEDLFAALASGKNPTATMNDALTLFGKKSGLELATAAKEGKLGFDGLLKSITDGSGGIETTTENTRSLSEKFDILGKTLMTSLQPLATTVLDAVTKGADRFIAAMKSKPVEDFARVIKEDVLKGIAGMRAELEKPAWQTFFRNVESIAKVLAHDLAEGLKAIRDQMSKPDFKHFADEVGIIAATLSGDMLRATKDLGPAIKDTVGWLSDHKEVVKAAFAVMAVGASVWAATTIAAWLSTQAVAAREAAMMALDWVIAMGPIGWAIALIGVAAVEIAMHWKTITKDFDAFRDAFMKGWTVVSAAVETGLHVIAGFISDIWNKDIIGPIRDAVGIVTKIGGDIMQGLHDGITGSTHLVTDAIKWMTNQIPGPIKDFFKISSPSQMFAGFGANLMEGMALGITGNAHLPGNALAGVMGSLGGVGALSGRLGGTASINLNVHAPGATMDTVAALRSVAQTEVAGALRSVLRSTTAGSGSR